MRRARRLFENGGRQRPVEPLGCGVGHAETMGQAQCRRQQPAQGANAMVVKVIGPILVVSMRSRAMIMVMMHLVLRRGVQHHPAHHFCGMRAITLCGHHGLQRDQDTQQKKQEASPHRINSHPNACAQSGVLN